MSRHQFINVFKFGGEWYCAEAIVKAEEAFGLVIDPEVHPDLQEAVEEFLGGWLAEVVECHNRLLLLKQPGSQ
jgi:hypothetical protein